MPSSQNEKVVITQLPMLKWKVNAPAPEAEQKEFWSQLRRFYRTGIKPDQNPNKHLTSVFHAVLEGEHFKYPFRLGDKEIAFGPSLICRFLSHQITHYQKDIRNDFKEKLQELISGLSKLLNVTDKNQENETVYDFATEIIAFDKLSELIPGYKGPQLPEDRKERLQQVLKNLKEGLNWYNARKAILITSGKNIFFDEVPFQNVKIIKVKEENAFHEMERIIREQMKTFTSLMRSFRVASLEVEDQYRDEVHDDYFDHFSWYRLLEKEKSLYHPVFLILDHNTLAGQLDALSMLLSANWPVKLLVLNQQRVSEPNKQISWEEASHHFRQELSSFAISHRNVYAYQSTLDDPEALSRALERCLQANNPSVVHLLVPSGSELKDLMISRAASLGRYFPGIDYDPAKDGLVRSRLNIHLNSDPTKNWPAYSLQIRSDGKERPLNVTFTYADYKAFFETKVDELMLIPSSFYNDYLISLDEYLQLEQDQLYGKIPFIWLIDKQYNLHRAAVPNVWVVSCQERQDFWNFLQEMAGNNISAVSKEQGHENTDALEVTHEQELARLREEAIRLATERLIKELLNDE